MKTSVAFPSKYLKADDLDDMDMAVTIADIKMMDIGTEEKPMEKMVIYFNETVKGMVVNKTNCNQLERILKSSETDDWIGKRIGLWPNHDIEFRGDIVSAIRIRTKLPIAEEGSSAPF